MKYRHAFHAGNFADVHKHIALLALLRALQRKDKGFFYLDTHAGRGRYTLTRGDALVSNESRSGAVRLLTALQDAGARRLTAPELADYVAVIEAWRRSAGAPHGYPGSPLIAAHVLRPHDRGVAVEAQPAEFEALRKALGRETRVLAEHGDGYQRLRAHLPPAERRGLVLIDPPYEDTRGDFRAAASAVHDALERFATGVVALWYPIKDGRDTDRWRDGFAQRIARPTIAAEFWMHPTDSRAGLNGSGLAIVNPPFQFADRCDVWQGELLRHLAAGVDAGSRVVSLASETR